MICLMPPEDPSELPLHWLGRKHGMVFNNTNKNDKHHQQDNKTRIKKKVNLNLTVMGVDSLLNRCRCIPETCSGRTTQQYGFTGLPGNDMVSHLPGKGTVLQETESCECSLARGEREKGIFFFFYSRRLLTGQAPRTGAKGNGLDSAFQASLFCEEH